MACCLVAPSHCLNLCWLIIINLVLFLNIYKYIGIRILGFSAQGILLVVSCWCQAIAWTRVDLTSCKQVHWLECWKLICWGVILQYMSVLAPTDPLLPGSVLTHLPLDKMAAISQTVFSYAFLWMKSFVFWLEFHWCLFPRIQLTINQHWFR